MENPGEPSGAPTMPPQSPGDEHPVFICYRQQDGKGYARWIYSALVEGLRACDDPTDVYFDQVAPAASDWTAIHKPALEQACCLIVILTPGLYSDLGANDWVHKELDWWLENRKKVPPILVDAINGDDRWIPKKIKSRWPRAQRVNLAEDLWAQAEEEDRQQIRDQKVQQILEAIKGSRFEVLEQVGERARRVKRRLRVAAIAAAVAVAVGGLAYLGYRLSPRYQIDAILKSAPIRTVVENYQPMHVGGPALEDYLRALATYRPEEAQRAALQISDLNTKKVALISVANGQVDAGQMAEAGETLQQALRTAERMQNNPYNKTDALVSIAEGQVGAGRMAEAAKTWEEALRTAEPAYSLVSVARGQAKARQFVEADRTAQQITDPYDKTGVLVSIAEQQVRAGQRPEARETLAEAKLTARDVKDYNERLNYTMLTIVAGQAKAGYSVEAAHTAESITASTYKDEALTFIVFGQAQTGQFAEAEQTVARVTNLQYKEIALEYLADGQAQRGHFYEAEQTAKKIRNPTAALRLIVDAEAMAGQLDEAVHTANQITDPDGKGAALISIAEAYAEGNQIDDAERTIRKIPEWLQNAPRVWLAEAQARAGKWKAARATADLCTSYFQLRAYAAILNQYAKSNQKKPRVTLRQTGDN